MTYLEIDFGSGDRRTVELDKRQPVSIGQHPSNDVSIAGDDVELMHCRISWHKSSGYEVIAAGSDGVDVNGTLVQKARLVPGDVMRIGPANVIFRDENASPPETADFKAAEVDIDSYSLKPLSSEVEIPAGLPGASPAASPPAASAPATSMPAADDDDPPLTADEIITDDAPLTAEEIFTGEPIEEQPPRKRKKSRSESAEDRSHRKRKRSRSERDDRDTAGANGQDRNDIDESAGERPLSRGSSRRGEDVETRGGDETADRPAGSEVVNLRERFRPRPVRPGDRDAARSPLVLGLSGLALVLLLLGATFYFIIGRQTTQAEFDAAQALMDEGRYNEAIAAFQRFLSIHPRDALADEAEIQLWISRVERHASGASPDWTKALEELNGFINARRDAEGFEDLHDIIRRKAEAIAEGAAKDAGKLYDRNLLAVSGDAANLVTIYTPQETPPTDILKRIESARRISEASILKHEAFTGAVSQIDAALARKEPMVALDTRRELLARYPEFEANGTIQTKLAATLNTERELVSRSEETVDALMDDHAWSFPPPLSLTFHARSRTDEVSVGSTVFGVAKDTCYAVDSITGEPVWRRVIGWDTPFFPIPVSANVPSLIVFDTNHDELVLLNQQTGEVLWRQPEVTGVSSAPLVEERQIYAVSATGTLSKVDLETGSVISRLHFSQPVSSPAALNDGARLVVCGEREVLYTLSRRPLECVAVSYLGHKPKGVVAPLLPMGALLLVAENLPGEQAALHVLDTRNSDDTLSEAVRRVIPGHVVDSPVIRGRDLFVPSTGERVASFTVTDEQGQPPLTDGPSYEAEGAQRSPVYLATGPDRQVWMASRHLRKLRLTADSVEPGQQLIRIGTAAQPLQQLGKRIYVGRKLPYSSAVTLFQSDRDQLATQWETVIGARILALAAFPDQSGVIVAAESGDIYRVTPSRLVDGGFLTSTTVRLKVPDNLSSALEGTTLPDGKILVWSGDPQPQLWIINRLGQVEREMPLPGVLQTAPARLGSRLALPLPGRIHLIAERGSQPAVQDFALPQGDTAPPAWRQVLAVDDSSLVAVTESGQLHLLRLQENPQAWLAEAGTLEAGGPIDFDVAFADGQIGLAVGERLQLVDAATLEPLAETSLEGVASGGASFSGGLLFVETDRNALRCFQTQPQLAQLWSTPLPNISLSASPLVTEDQRSVIASLKDGTVINVDAETGEVRETSSVGQTLSSGPQAVESGIIVATSDGSLVRVESILNAEQP